MFSTQAPYPSNNPMRGPMMTPSYPNTNSRTMNGPPRVNMASTPTTVDNEAQHEMKVLRSTTGIVRKRKSICTAYEGH